jgi:hypothetical protein
MSFSTSSSKALPYQFRRYPIHAKHRDTSQQLLISILVLSFSCRKKDSNKPHEFHESHLNHQLQKTGAV